MDIYQFGFPDSYKSFLAGRKSSTSGLTVTDIQIEWLIQAVKHVKSQKQRPDRDRICHHIQQKHDITSATVSLLLDWAVKNEILTTTITRGNTDKLTYVIVNSESASATTIKDPSSTSITSKSPAAKVAAIKVPATKVPTKVVAATKVAVPTTSGLETNNNNKQLDIHNKSDISPLMVRAVKG